MDRFPPDHDLELLDAHLDGALAAGESKRLWGRLSREPSLAAALERLRAERSVRRDSLASFEPTPPSADAFASHVLAGLSGANGWNRTSRFLRRAAAVAAGFAVAFAGGWVARGSASALPAPSGPPGHLAAAASMVQVALTDEQGKIVAVQRFDDLRQAAQFADDVGRWQARRRQVESGQLVPVSGEF